LIKRVQSVQVRSISTYFDYNHHLIKGQHITRKIYMLEGLEPSIALTGGPWYTDNELDTEFIQNLTDVCHKLISDIVSVLGNAVFGVSECYSCRVFQNVVADKKTPSIQFPMPHNTQLQTISDIPLEKQG